MGAGVKNAGELHGEWRERSGELGVMHMTSL